MESESTPSNSNPFERHLSFVKKVALVAGVLGGVAGLCFVGAHLMLSDNPSLRGVIAFPFVFGIALSGMVTGLALLFAPANFFSSDQDKEYSKMIGTEKIATARVAIFIGLLLICAFLALVGAGVLQMLGVIDPPLPRRR